jgi:ribosomal small subunit protein bTHX
MGKGDQRSRRGKIHRGTFGKRRPKPNKHRSAPRAEVPAETTEAAPAVKEKTKEPKIVKKQPKE